MKRSQTPLMKRSSSSFSVPSPPAAAAAAAPDELFEFPSSPQSVVGEGITHYAHAKHPLTEVTPPERFTCTGCKEYGAGRRFACQQCDFQLHHFCAVTPPVLKNHPLHGQHHLVLHSKPRSGGISWPRCDVCGKSSKGFTFRCKACNFQMHPCCAMLSTEIKYPAAHPHPLRLLPAMNMPANAGNGAECGACNKRRSGRMYRCTVCEYHLHAVCAKSSINGLQENGYGIPPPEKPNALGTAARLTSQVFIEFIGGLIEGFGEGVGEAIVQNMVRGRCISRRRIQD